MLLFFRQYLRWLLLLVFLLLMSLGIWVLLPSSKTPDFSQFSAGPERKAAFIEYMLPLVSAENEAVLAQRQRVLNWEKKRDVLGWWSSYQLSRLAEDYGMQSFNPENQADWEQLISKIDQVAPSLALAQAAVESGWGTSRFSREGKNFFGQWCYQAGCGLVPNQRETGKTHEVASFESAAESVHRYLHNLNTHRSYAELRGIRVALRQQNKTLSGMVMAQGLSAYSERGQAYIDSLIGIIKVNKLAQYDVAR